MSDKSVHVSQEQVIDGSRISADAVRMLNTWLRYVQNGDRLVVHNGEFILYNGDSCELDRCSVQ